VTPVRFDEAISTALDLIRAQLGERLGRIILVRDVAGRISAVLNDQVLQGDEWDTLAQALDERLGRYSPGFRRALVRRSDLIDPSDICESPDLVRLPEAGDAWLIDRLLTNQEWLRRPHLGRPRLPVAAAFSLKGGVGRSTAMAVWAWYLARQGRRVVAIDLDLEAPGLGSLLLDELPAYGMVDWLVEALLEQPDPGLLDDCLGFSPVANDTEGIIQVISAFGAKTQDYVAKVGRVYLPGLTAEGREIGFPERIDQLIAALANRQDPPDVVLLDSRAGLHDIGAAVVTQLGAEVFLFARDEPQSWQAFRLLFEHLSKSEALRFGMPDDDLRWRLKMVAAQVDKTEGAIANWLDASYDTWSLLYDDDTKATEETPAMTFVRDDPSAPHHPLIVYYDGGLRSRALVDFAQRPPWSVVEAAFGEFLVGATTRLLGSDQTSEDESREEV
jgi:MinD-like ATPase involved in chromosome partitioning or flagellar assembly